LVFGMRLGLRVSWALAFVSLSAALVPALVPGTGVVIDPDGWWPAGALWGTSVLGLGWRDRWVFDARGWFRRERGWGPLVLGRQRPLDGFAGWRVESVPGPFQNPNQYRGALTFRTDEGTFRLDGTFKAERLEQERPALDLWSQWWAEGRQT
jgi:hypothetical protein